MKKLFLALLSVILFLPFPAFSGDKGFIGISMPTKSSLRWIRDGQELHSALKAKGYGVYLQYAEDDIPNQISQIESMLTKDPKALIIAPVDDSTLVPILKRAEENGVPVISYDRLIRNSTAVHAYLTFDNFKVGMLQAQSLLKGLGYPSRKGPFNVELFGGSPDDKNAFFFYEGAMSVLQPLIHSNVLVVKSGQTGMKKVGVLRWSMENTQARMDNILSAFYSDGSRVDAVLSPADFLSRSIISSLRGLGYGTLGYPWPVISGQDAEIPSIRAIINGEQYSTVFKDVRKLAKATASVIDDILSARSWEDAHDLRPYDNGARIVFARLLTPVLVDKNNYKKILLDSGYMTEHDLR